MVKEKTRLPKVKTRWCRRCGRLFVGGVVSKVCGNCYKTNHNKMVGLKSKKNGK